MDRHAERSDTASRAEGQDLIVLVLNERIEQWSGLNSVERWKVVEVPSPPRRTPWL